jgi:hypothetical protein
VVITTIIASLLKASTLPGLKPNQPTQSRRIASVSQPELILIGVCGLLLKPRFRSSIQICSTMASPAAPAAPWTTRPPAKSTMPFRASQPVGFQIHAAGRFQIRMK